MVRGPCALRVTQARPRARAGPMEGSWATALALQTLDLSDNELSGPLPDAWGAPNGFRSLQRLQVRPVGSGPARPQPAAPCTAALRLPVSLPVLLLCAAGRPCAPDTCRRAV